MFCHVSFSVTIINVWKNVWHFSSVFRQPHHHYGLSLFDVFATVWLLFPHYMQYNGRYLFNWPYFSLYGFSFLSFCLYFEGYSCLGSTLLFVWHSFHFFQAINYVCLPLLGSTVWHSLPNLLNYLFLLSPPLVILSVFQCYLGIERDWKMIKM